MLKAFRRYVNAEILPNCTAINIHKYENCVEYTETRLYIDLRYSD